MAESRNPRWMIQLKWSDEETWKDYQEIPELLRPFSAEYLEDVYWEWRLGRERYKLNYDAEFRIV